MSIVEKLGGVPGKQVISDVLDNSGGGSKSPIYTEENVIFQNLDILKSTCWVYTPDGQGFYTYRPIIPLNIELKSGDSFEAIVSTIMPKVETNESVSVIKWRLGNSGLYRATASIQNVNWFAIKDGHDSINTLAAIFNGSWGLISNYEGLLDSIDGLFAETNPNNLYSGVMKNAKTLLIGDSLYNKFELRFCRATVIKVQ